LSLFVDTSVWSLALRRDSLSGVPEVGVLTQAIQNSETILTTGLVIQELLQGFSGPQARDLILDRFSAVPLLAPDREDHIQAAELRNRCRRSGVQVGTVDVLLAELCIRHDLTMLTTDQDFKNIAGRSALRVWMRPTWAQAGDETG
jgi:predicted nucleic acid-binding protein